MLSDFTGRTGQLYALYRRDLPDEQAAALAAALGLTAGGTVVDLGCGTGQLAVPLRRHCQLVLGLDPEPEMLHGMRARRVGGVVPVLADDADLPLVAGLLREAPQAVVIGNALHWMDEPVALRRCAEAAGAQGAVAVITQGPPLWLGPAAWQRRLRTVLQEHRGTAAGTCGSTGEVVHARELLMRELGLQCQVLSWPAAYVVDADWVLGHLGSALAADALGTADAPSPLAKALRRSLSQDGETLVERVATTAVVGRRRG